MGRTNKNNVIITKELEEELPIDCHLRLELEKHNKTLITYAVHNVTLNWYMQTNINYNPYSVIYTDAWNFLDICDWY